MKINKPIKILTAQITEKSSQSVPGTVESIEKHKGIMVCTRDVDLLLTQVQPAGKKMMDAYSFHIGARIEKGELFG